MITEGENTNGERFSKRATPIASGTHGLAELLGLVRRRGGWFAFGTALGITLAVVYCFQADVLYESSAEILVMQKDSNLPTQATDSGMGNIDSRINKDLLGTHMQIITSRSIAQRAIEQGRLETLPSVQEVLGDGERFVDYVVDNLNVTRGGKGQAQSAHVLNISFTHTSPKASALILGAVVESYESFVGEKFQDVNSEAVDLIARAKNELSTNISEQEEEYRRFRSDALLMWNGDHVVNLHQTRLMEIERELAQNRLRVAQVKSRLAVVEAAAQDDANTKYTDLERMALIDDADIQRLSLLVAVQRGEPASESFQATQPARAETASTEYDRLLQLQLDEKTLALEVGENHPKLKEIRQSIQQLGQFLKEKRDALGQVEDRPAFDVQDFMNAYARLLKHDLTDLEKRREELEAFSNAERLGAKDLVSDELEDESKRRELARTQSLYDTVVARLGEINLIRDYGGFVIEVIEPVELGEQVWPNLPLTLGVGAVLGLLLGGTAAFGVDMLDKTFRDPEEVRDALHAPLLIHVPNLVAESRRIAQRTDGEQTSDLSPMLLTYHRPNSRESEAFRGLRTSLYFSSFTSGHKVIQVASPLAGDGKTTLVSNLAVSMAQANKKVLLIDCDLRRPRVHDVFSMDRVPGVTDVLLGEIPCEQAIRPSGIENLSLITAGTMVPNPGELLTLHRFDQLIKSMRDQYDFVLVDSPPLLPVSDPLAIAARSDAVILQVRIRRNGRPAAIKAREMLDEIGAEVLGVVVSGADETQSYSYDYYGYRAYGYRSRGSGDRNYYDHYYSDETATGTKAR